ncbi:MAG: sugar-binding domain-containing protein [Roseovarius sp.]
MGSGFSKEDEAKIGMYWASPLTEGKVPMSTRSLHEGLQRPDVQKLVGVQFKKPFPSSKALERAARNAFVDGNLRVELKLQTDPPALCTDLSDALREKFRNHNVDNFHVCLVDRVPLGSSIPFEVGRRAGRYLLEKTNFVKDGDRIGVGSGRGVQGVAKEMVARKKHESTQNVTLFSMLGQTKPASFARKRQELFNANQNTAEMANSFIQQVWVKLMPGHLAYQDIDVAKKNTWLEHLDEIDGKFIGAGGRDDVNKPVSTFWKELITEEEKSRLPNTAIVGVGALEPGHVLYDLVRGRDEQSAQSVRDYLEPIAPQLSEIIDLCDQLRTHPDYGGYSAVGEVCNRYFLNSAPEEIAGFKDVRDARLKIHAKLHEITEKKILCTPKRMYSLMERLAVVAGGAEKSFAVRTLIEHPMIHITHLFVDSEMATRLLAS